MKISLYFFLITKICTKIINKYFLNISYTIFFKNKTHLQLLVRKTKNKNDLTN